MAERGIELAWVERVLRAPERVHADRTDPTLTHALGRIEEQDQRVLRVVYNASASPPRVVTAYFDRRQRRAMKMHYDEKADALYLRLDDSTIVESEEVKPGIVLDFNAEKQVVGIEVLDLKRRVPKADLKQLKLEVA
jgi:uncharacterized protein YuzE